MRTRANYIASDDLMDPYGRYFAFLGAGSTPHEVFSKFRTREQSMDDLRANGNPAQMVGGHHTDFQYGKDA